MAISGADSNSLGASTGLFGVIGAVVGYLIFNWVNMSYEGSPRNVLLCQLVFILVMTFLLNGQYSSTAPHLCGLLSGVFIGCFLSERFQNPAGMSPDITPHERTTKNVGTGVTIALGVLFLSLTLLN